MSQPWAQRLFTDHDIPTGRTPESFAYKIAAIWSGLAVDTYYTDHQQEASRVIGHSLLEAYTVQVTHAGRTQTFSEDT